MRLSKNLIASVCLSAVFSGVNATAASAPVSAAATKQIANLQKLLTTAKSQTYAYQQAVNGWSYLQYNRCGSGYSRAIEQCQNNLVNSAAYQAGPPQSYLNSLKTLYPYAGLTKVIQDTISDLQHPGHFYSDSNFSLGK